jgi:hypothetical protein
VQKKSTESDHELADTSIGKGGKSTILLSTDPDTNDLLRISIYTWNDING